MEETQKGERGAHTQTATEAGPDYCAECSARWNEWVMWPCDKQHAVFCKGNDGGYDPILSCCRGARYYPDADAFVAHHSGSKESS